MKGIVILLVATVIVVSGCIVPGSFLGQQGLRFSSCEWSGTLLLCDGEWVGGGTKPYVNTGNQWLGKTEPFSIGGGSCRCPVAECGELSLNDDPTCSYQDQPEHGLDYSCNAGSCLISSVSDYVCFSNNGKQGQPLLDGTYLACRFPAGTPANFDKIIFDTSGQLFIEDVEAIQPQPEIGIGEPVSEPHEPIIEPVTTPMTTPMVEPEPKTIFDLIVDWLNSLLDSFGSASICAGGSC